MLQPGNTRAEQHAPRKLKTCAGSAAFRVHELFTEKSGQSQAQTKSNNSFHLVHEMGIEYTGERYVKAFINVVDISTIPHQSQNLSSNRS